MRQDFTRLNFGWWGFWAPEGREDGGTQADLIEYGTSRAAAAAAPSLRAARPTDVGGSRRCLQACFHRLNSWDCRREPPASLREAQACRSRAQNRRATQSRRPPPAVRCERYGASALLDFRADVN